MALRVEGEKETIHLIPARSSDGQTQSIEVPTIYSEFTTGTYIFRYLRFQVGQRPSPLDICAGIWPTESMETLENRILVQMRQRLESCTQRERDLLGPYFPNRV